MSYTLPLLRAKKRMGKDGKMFYEKHKIFLYREDFEKFIESLNSVCDYIKANQEELPQRDENLEMELNEVETNYSAVDFDDLGK